MKRLLSNLTSAHAIALTALFVALSSSAGVGSGTTTFDISRIKVTLIRLG